MDDAIEIAAVWSLHGTSAHLHCGELAATIDLARPDLGLQRTTFHGAEVAGTLCSIVRDDKKVAGLKKDWPLPLVDRYVRGDDVVASYGEVSEWPYAPQIYWQANSLDQVDDVRASLSIMLSVQTDLLDTHPRISITSRMATCETLYVSTDEKQLADLVPVHGELVLEPASSFCCLIRRIANFNASYLEVVRTSDFCRARVGADTGGSSHVEWQLFADFLEKGVIRRARIHSAWLPRERDVELAVECCAALEQAPLPLTA